MNGEPVSAGEYWYKDEGGGPTLYVCEIINGELMCGPKSSGCRFHLDGLRMKTSEWMDKTNET